MVKFQKSIIFKVLFLIIILQIIIWVWIATTINKQENEILTALNNQQKSFVVNFIEKQKNKTKEKILQNLKNLVEYSTASLGFSLFNYEENSAKKIISDVLLENENIKGVVVFDTVTKSVFVAGYKQNGKKILSTDLLPKKFDKYDFFKKKIIYKNQPIGYIKIYYDLNKALAHLDEIMNEELGLVNLKFNQIYENTKEKEKKLLIYFLIAAFLTIFVIVYTLNKFINIPLKEIKKGLAGFFEFLANPKTKIYPIKINSEDEFGEIAKFTNHGIAVGSKLHRELAEMMDVIDKNVMICEFDENGNVISVTKAFEQICGYSESEITKKRKKILCDIDINSVINTIEKEGSWRGEIKCKAKNAKEIWLFSTITKKCTFDGSCRYINILYNITDKKELENMKNNLELIVDEKTSKIKSLLNMTKESIRYASLIQKSILPGEDIFKKCFKEYFIIWEPKDVLGGDIYFLDEVRDGEYLLMVIDCTGHGVHGALMTMLVKAAQLNIINRLTHEEERISPSKILSEFNNAVKTILKQYSKSSISNAGFDGAVLYYDKNNRILKFASANVPLFYVKDNTIKEIKGDKRSVGDVFTKNDYVYKEYNIPLSDDIKYYITTDGFLDQLGGYKEYPFGKKRFKDLILKIQNLSFEKQKEIFVQELSEYQKNEPRTDDITLIGFKL